jgi:hypothetical protein
MATLTAYNAATPLNASDNVYLTFTASTTGEVLSRAAAPTNTDVGNVLTLSWRVEAGRTTAGDDTFVLAIRVMSGTTVLAAADSGGTFSNVATIPTGTTADSVYGPTAFAYVNTTASAAQWAAATVELRQTFTANMGTDGAAIKVDHVQFTGTYNIQTLAPTLLSPADGATADGTLFEWQFNTQAGDTQGKYAFRRSYDALGVVSGTPTLPDSGQGVDFSPDGARLAVGFNTTPFLRVYNTSDWSTVSGTPTLAGATGGLSFSRDGIRLAIPHSNTPYFSLLNTSDWSTVSGLPALALTGRRSAFAPGDTLIAVTHVGSPNLRVLGQTKTEWWNGTTWTTTETFITSSAQTLSLPSSAWT